MRKTILFISGAAMFVSPVRAVSLKYQHSDVSAFVGACVSNFPWEESVAAVGFAMWVEEIEENSD